KHPGMGVSAFIEPCLPSPADRLPSGSDWIIHEIKLDGFRMMVRRDLAGVRLLTRNGHDWTGRFPLIAEAAGGAAGAVVPDRRRGSCLRRRWATGVRPAALPTPGRAGVPVCVRPA